MSEISLSTFFLIFLLFRTFLEPINAPLSGLFWDTAHSMNIVYANLTVAKITAFQQKKICSFLFLARFGRKLSKTCLYFKVGLDYSTLSTFESSVSEKYVCWLNFI